MRTALVDPLLTVVPCARVPITACTPERAAREVVRLATSTLDRGVDVHLCNAYTLAIADREAGFRSTLQRASLNFPDGKAVVWANKVLHRSREIPSDRVYGPDLFLDVFDAGQNVGLRHYLLGSTPGVLAGLEAELRRRFPRADIAGVESPPFRPLTDTEVQERNRRIAACRAQVVWVGLGTPKQDWEVARLAAHLPVVSVAVGAAFDFVAGAKRQAPGWMRDRGLEWLYRLAGEPRRLWRRYLFGNARFVMAALTRGRSQVNGCDRA